MRQLIKNANVFDGYNEKLTENANIIIQDNLVEDIVQGVIPEEQFDMVIDAGGRTVMPGMIDAHAHLYYTSTPYELDSMREDEIAVRSAAMAKAVLLNGFTTVREAGGLICGLKKAIDDGVVDGPRVFPSGGGITQTNGHADLRSHRAHQIINGVHTSPHMRTGAHVIADGVPECLRVVRQQFFLGATQIKIMAGGGILSMMDHMQTVQFTEEEMKAIVGAAADYGTYVMAHLYTPAQMQRAAKCGVMSFEHATLMDDETARIIKDKGIWVVPGPQFPGPREDAHRIRKSSNDKWMMAVSGEKQMTELINKYNLNILYATDLGAQADMQNDLAHQIGDFRLFKKRFGSLVGIRAATGNGHEMLKMCTYRNPYDEGKLGVLEKGSYADLLIVDGNPVEDLDILADRNNMRIIMKDGKIYKNTIDGRVYENLPWNWPAGTHK